MVDRGKKNMTPPFISPWATFSVINFFYHRGRWRNPPTQCRFGTVESGRGKERSKGPSRRILLLTFKLDGERDRVGVS